MAFVMYQVNEQHCTTVVADANNNNNYCSGSNNNNVILDCSAIGPNARILTSCNRTGYVGVFQIEAAPLYFGAFDLEFWRMLLLQ
jgi:hypothetical protein